MATAPATVKSLSPEEVLSQLLQSGNAVNPNASVDITPYLPSYGSTPQQEAQDKISLQYGPQERALTQAAQDAAKENLYQRNTEQNYGQIIDPRLENIYGALGGSLSQDRAATQSNYQGAIDKIRSYYDQAQQSGQGVNSDLLNRITQSAQRLGLGAAVPDATQRLAGNYQFNQGQLAQGEAGRSANLTGLAAQMFGLDTGRMSSAAQEGAQARAGVQAQVLSTLGNLLRANQKEQGGYRNQLTGLKGQEATDLRKTLGDIMSQRSQDTVNARKSAIAEFLQRAGLAQQAYSDKASLAQSQQSEAERRREFDVGQANANARAAAARGRSGSGKTVDPLSQLLKIAQIESIQGNLKKGSGQKLTGQAALDQLLNSPSPYWGEQTKSVTTPGRTLGFGGVKDPFGSTTRQVGTGQSNPTASAQFQQDISDLLNTAATQSVPADINHPKLNPYDVALSLIPKFAKEDPNALRAAISAYYKGYTVPGNTDDLLSMLLSQYLGQ